MTRQDFILRLRAGLVGLPAQVQSDRLHLPHHLG